MLKGLARRVISPSLAPRQVSVPFEAFEADAELPKNLVASEWWQRVVEMPKEVLETRPFHGDFRDF